MNNRGKRRTPEQVVRKLRGPGALLHTGRSLSRFLPSLGVSEVAYHCRAAPLRRRAGRQTRRLQTLERENARRKRLPAKGGAEQGDPEGNARSSGKTVGPARERQTEIKISTGRATTFVSKMPKMSAGLPPPIH